MEYHLEALLHGALHHATQDLHQGLKPVDPPDYGLWTAVSETVSLDL